MINENVRHPGNNQTTTTTHEAIDLGTKKDSKNASVGPISQKPRSQLQDLILNPDYLRASNGNNTFLLNYLPAFFTSPLFVHSLMFSLQIMWIFFYAAVKVCPRYFLRENDSPE